MNGMGQPRVVAAIDFGTHGTGFAWTGISQDNGEISARHVSFFEDWPHQLSYPKTRSAVLLDAQGNLLSWGSRAEADMAAMPKGSGWRLAVGFKMGLRDTTSETTSVVAALGAQAGIVLDARAKDAYLLTVLCLQQVIAVARDHITRGAYEDQDIRWCLTVPAIWDHYTRDLLFKAAVAAGLPDDPDRLLLCQEPAAAALYCVAKGEALLSTPGTRFMVVDAGGGTVDITSFQVAEDGRLNELAPATGAFAGSDFINRAFLDDVLGEQFGTGIMGRIINEQRAALVSTMEAWERAKRGFSLESREELVIPLSAPFYATLLKEQLAGRWRGGEDPATEVVISRELATSLFDKSVDATMTHVTQHLAEMRTISGVTGGEIIVLVGGFAESPYLRATFTERMAGESVRVVIPEQPSVAVLAGAVHFAYDPSVFLSWRAPFTLGIGVAKSFEPGKDPESRKITNFAGRQLCLGRFDIFVANRDALLPDEPVTRTYHPIAEDQTTIELSLLSTARRDPRYADEPGAESVASVTIDLSGTMDVPVEEREVEVAMYFAQTRVRVEARNVHTNEPVTVDIEWRATW